jgi:predicted metal-dependent hydrolase
MTEDTQTTGSQIPAHRVRVSKRAKRVLLRVIPGEGLEIVVPVGFDGRSLPAILDRHRAWIARQLDRLGPMVTVELADLPLPERIPLLAEGMIVEMAYQACGEGILQLKQRGRARLEMTGDLADRAGCILLLQRWLKHRARRHLATRLQEVSMQTGLRYRSIQMRSQKSRWGSCSNRGTISLNCKLMFIQPELVHYLLIHELCHTIHMNHSEQFWSLVKQHEPDYLNLDSQLHKARDGVPPWADYS